MMALASALEALRMANRVAARNFYAWCLVGMDGLSTPASNGTFMQPYVSLQDLEAGEKIGMVFVCADSHAQEATTAELMAALRRLADNLVPPPALALRLAVSSPRISDWRLGFSLKTLSMKREMDSKPWRSTLKGHSPRSS